VNISSSTIVGTLCGPFEVIWDPASLGVHSLSRQVHYYEKRGLVLLHYAIHTP